MFQTLRSHRRIPHQKARGLTAALVLNAKFPQPHHSPKPNSLRVQRKRTAAHETLPLVVGRRKKEKKNKKKRPKNTLQRRLEAHPLPACHAGRTPHARPLAEPRAGSAARWVGVGAGRPRGNPTPPSPQRPFAPQSAACSVGGEGGGLVYKSPYSLPIIESLRGGRASFPPPPKKSPIYRASPPAFPPPRRGRGGGIGTDSIPPRAPPGRLLLPAPLLPLPEHGCPPPGPPPARGAARRAGGAPRPGRQQSPPSAPRRFNEAAESPWAYSRPPRSPPRRAAPRGPAALQSRLGGPEAPRAGKEGPGGTWAPFTAMTARFRGELGVSRAPHAAAPAAAIFSRTHQPGRQAARTAPAHSSGGEGRGGAAQRVRMRVRRAVVAGCGCACVVRC